MVESSSTGSSEVCNEGTLQNSTSSGNHFHAFEMSPLPGNGSQRVGSDGTFFQVNAGDNAEIVVSRPTLDLSQVTNYTAGIGGYTVSLS